MRKIHKIVMGALLGGIAVSQSHGYGKTLVQAADSLLYRDTSAVSIQRIPTIEPKPTATPAAKPTPTPNAKPTATPAAKPTATPEPKITGKVTATPEPKITGKVTATPEPKISGKITVTPEPKSGAKVTATPGPKLSFSLVESQAQSMITRIFSFFSGLFK